MSCTKQHVTLVMYWSNNNNTTDKSWSHRCRMLDSTTVAQKKSRVIPKWCPWAFENRNSEKYKPKPKKARQKQRADDAGKQSRQMWWVSMGQNICVFILNLMYSYHSFFVFIPLSIINKYCTYKKNMHLKFKYFKKWCCGKISNYCWNARLSDYTAALL